MLDFTDKLFNIYFAYILQAPFALSGVFAVAEGHKVSRR